MLFVKRFVVAVVLMAVLTGAAGPAMASEHMAADDPDGDSLMAMIQPYLDQIRPYLAPLEEIIENIDIGGVSLVRAAAKNYENTLVITSPADYEKIIIQYALNGIDKDFRRNLAARAFECSARYDKEIAEYFNLRESFNLSLPSSRMAIFSEKIK